MTTHISIIPAEPGYRALFRDDDNFFVGEPIIAWRIETIRDTDDEDFSSYTFPVGLDGDIAKDCVGAVHPDGRVTIWGDTELASVAEAVAHLKKQSG